MYPATDHELLLVLHGVAVRLALGHGDQRERHVAAVVGVGRDAAGDLAGEMPRGDRRQVGAADAGLLLGVLADQSARTHAADAAAGADLADRTGLHLVGARERRADAARFGVREHLERRGIDALLFRHRLRLLAVAGPRPRDGNVTGMVGSAGRWAGINTCGSRPTSRGRRGWWR